MASEWQQGAKYVRDGIVCSIIGLQNADGNDEDSIEYQTLQRVMDMIGKKYGEFAKPVK